MSQKMKCQSCQGVYFPVQADGTTYYHACPPVYDEAKGTVSERADKRDENISVDAAGKATGIKSAGKGAVEVAAGPG